MTPFSDFFMRAVGKTPYAYQRRLAEVPAWPDALEVPTGAGKTAAVVLAWLWRRRHATREVRAATGRRLVLCLPMRTLTSQTTACVTTWLDNLALPERPMVHTLLGGAVDDDWIGRPEAEAIIIGTQDMLLSRALNRGFGMSSRYAWPMAFALLHNDVQWVFDEVQLMGVGASTGSQLAVLREALGTQGTHHSLWMSATLDSSVLQTVDRIGQPEVLRLDPQDSDTGSLARLLDAPKSLSQLVAGESVAEAALRVHATGTRTLVVVNTVKRAQSVYSELEGRRPDAPLALLHSRFRPGDRAEVEARVLSPAWSGILVATQVIEAGVDISARALVTDLAPWSSIVQRAGRCNRWAEHDAASVLVVDLPDDDDASRPYDLADLRAARAILADLTNASPRSLAGIPSVRRGVVTPVLRRRDLLDLFETSADLSGADIDVSPYVRSSDDTDVAVAWRGSLGLDAPGDDEPLPGREERCAVPIGAARPFLDRLRKAGLRAWRWHHRDERWVAVERALPGDTWIVPASAGGYSTKLGFIAEDPREVPLLVPGTVLAEGEGMDRGASGAPESLTEHAGRVVRAVSDLCDRCGLSDAGERADLLLAARWHDAGKAHPVFQRTMQGEAYSPEVVLAKSNHRRRHERRGFRHEIASALALLADHPLSFRAAYLVAAHHGRARTIVRARPGEPPAPAGRRFALGIWDGDRLPAADLGGGVLMPEQTLSLAMFEFGGGGTGEGWTARALGLRDAHGVFRLAWLESLLRSADWRASAPDSGGQ